jgi:parvulin-like peptidyl-prolyl isomerase
MTRRARSRHQRELQRQRLVIIVAGTAIGLALLAVLVGVGYDRVWIPSRPVAQVGSTSLSRGDYWTERRYEIARRMAQNIQLLALFGGQFGSQFEGQIPQLDAQAATVRTDPIDDSTIEGWVDRQVILQSAAQDYNIKATEGDIAQQLVTDLARAFPAPKPPITSTSSLSQTNALSGTATVAPTAGATAAATAAPTATAGGPTATAAPTSTPAATNTPAPTAPPTATPLPEVALQEQDAVLGRLFDAYQQEILRLSPDATAPLKAQLTLDDFKQALRAQYERQAIAAKVEEQLLPEASFTPTTDPSAIEVRQILISTTTTLSDTQAVRDAALAKRKPEAEAILAQLRGGADFATLAKEKSDDFATRANGGTLPEFDKDGKTTDGRQMDPAIVKAALALKENEISDLIPTSFGWHIIQLSKRTVDSKESQLSTARTKKFDEWVAQKRAAATVARFPAVTPTPTTLATPSPAVLPTVQLVATPTATTVPTSTLNLTPTAGPGSPPPTAAATAAP